MNRTVLLVSRYGLGNTRPEDERFGIEMLDKLFHTVEKLAQKPQAICFYTEGVRCVVGGSPLLLGLQLLHGMGVEVVACGTCLEKYGLSDKVAVGDIGGMDAIVERMAGADKVVTV